MKGNVIVGQSGGPTAVINATLAGVYHCAKELGAAHIYGMRYGIQGLLQGKYIDLADYIRNDIDLEVLKRTPSAYLGSCRYKMPKLEDDEAAFAQLFEILGRLEIAYFLYIGGNDSMDTIAQLARYAERVGSDIRFIGVPKTIDNDLTVTDHCPGFGSAAKYIATSVKELIRDNKVNDMDVVTVVEIMGRDAGWLTASSALCRGPDCDGPDLIYLPELPFDIERFLARIAEIQKTERAVVVCVSEGIRLENGSYVCEFSTEGARTVDSFGHKQLTGTAAVLAHLVHGRLGCKVRAIEFSSLQRCASHIQSETDMNEAYAVGETGVRAAFAGETAKVVVIDRGSTMPYHSSMELCDVWQVANLKKEFPRAWMNDAGDNVTDAFFDYVRPLIQGEISPVIVDGLPRHMDLIR